MYHEPIRACENCYTPVWLIILHCTVKYNNYDSIQYNIIKFDIHVIHITCTIIPYHTIPYAFFNRIALMIFEICVKFLKLREKLKPVVSVLTG